MTRLDDDLDAFLNAADGAARQQALAQWLTHATPVLNLFMARAKFLKRLEIAVLRRRIVWNPDRLAQLLDEPDQQP